MLASLQASVFGCLTVEKKKRKPEPEHSEHIPADLSCVHICGPVLTYLNEGTEEGTDGAVGRQSCHRSIKDFLCQEVGRLILPQMLLLLHVALERHR